MQDRWVDIGRTHRGGTKLAISLVRISRRTTSLSERCEGELSVVFRLVPALRLYGPFRVFVPRQDQHMTGRCGACRLAGLAGRNGKPWS